MAMELGNLRNIMIKGILPARNTSLYETQRKLITIALMKASIDVFNQTNREKVAIDSGLMESQIGRTRIVRGNKLVELTSILTQDEAELKKMFKGADSRTISKWKQTLCLVPVVLAGCIGPNVDGLVPAQPQQVETATARPTATRLPTVEPSRTAIPTVRPTEKPPTKIPEKPTEPTPTEVSRQEKQAKEIWAESNRYLNAEGIYAEENLKNILFRTFEGTRLGVLSVDEKSIVGQGLLMGSIKLEGVTYLILGVKDSVGQRAVTAIQLLKRGLTADEWEISLIHLKSTTYDWADVHLTIEKQAGIDKFLESHVGTAIGFTFSIINADDVQKNPHDYIQFLYNNQEKDKGFLCSLSKFSSECTKIPTNLFRIGTLSDLDKLPQMEGELLSVSGLITHE